MDQRARTGEVTTGPGDETQHPVSPLGNFIDVFSENKLMVHDDPQIFDVLNFGDLITN